MLGTVLCISREAHSLCLRCEVCPRCRGMQRQPGPHLHWRLSARCGPPQFSQSCCSQGKDSWAQDGGLASPRGNVCQLPPQPPPVLRDHGGGSLRVICLDSQTENGAWHLGRSFLNSFHLWEWKLS